MIYKNCYLYLHNCDRHSGIFFPALPQIQQTKKYKTNKPTQKKNLPQAFMYFKIKVYKIFERSSKNYECCFHFINTMPIIEKKISFFSFCLRKETIRKQSWSPTDMKTSLTYISEAKPPYYVFQKLPFFIN